MRLVDKTILITGASSGIGHELARSLARQNRMVLLARRTDLLKTLQSQLPSRQEPHLIFPCDVGNQEQVLQVFQTLKEQNIVIDAAILNAGLTHRFQAANMSLPKIKQTFDVNFFGVVYFVEQLLPTMLTRKQGLIAATGSLAGYRGMPSAAAYSASKSALAVFLEGLRVDLIRSGIQFTLISPGFVDTPMIQAKRLPGFIVISTKQAVRIIVKGLEKGKTEIHFPYRLSLPAKIAKLIPDKLFARLAHGKH